MTEGGLCSYSLRNTNTKYYEPKAPKYLTSTGYLPYLEIIILTELPTFCYGTPRTELGCPFPLLQFQVPKPSFSLVA